MKRHRLVWTSQLRELFAIAQETGYSLDSFLIGIDEDHVILYKRGGKRRPYVEVGRQAIRASRV